MYFEECISKINEKLTWEENLLVFEIIKESWRTLGK